jgi:hypothetical protein
VGIELRKNCPHPQAKHLVFTSAGDRANLGCWLKGDRNFDIWVNYYGNEENRYKDQSDFYTSIKGGKFSNLHYVYQHWKDILNHYQAILVMDDDLIIDGSSISRLFGLREEYDLWLLQPAFNPRGKVSHSMTRVNPLTFMRYTNFVEMTCPLFRKDKLDNFMKVYNPVLIGYGVDYWYMDILGPDIEGKVVIVDAITCINPHDWIKGSPREIDILQSTSDRIKVWEWVKEQYQIQERVQREFNSIKRSLTLSIFVDTINIATHLVTVDGVKKKIKRLTKVFT